MSEDFEKLLLDRFDKAVADMKKKVWNVVVWVLGVFGVLLIGFIFQAGVTYATVKNIESTVEEVKHTVNSHIESEAATVRSIESNVNEFKQIVIANKTYIDILKNKSNGKGEN